MSRIFDCFTYDREDLVYERIALLGPHVDTFVIVEGTHTFQGTPKEASFDPGRVPEMFRHKIDYTLFDLSAHLGSGSAWTIEAAQRNALMSVVDKAGDDDFIILSDVDEIPRPDLLARRKLRPARLDMLNCYFYVDYICENAPIWSRAIVLKKPVLPDGMTFEHVRSRKLNHKLGNIANAGWHLSYLGGIDTIYEKISRFSHTELSDYANVSVEEYLNKIRNGIDIYDRSGRWGKLPSLPAYYDELLKSEYFRQYLAPDDIRVADPAILRPKFLKASIKAQLKKLRPLLFR
ncbi:hypothetical protein NOF55_06245 [Rhizobiaceae bacterium BDR2-2]|uniref:Beta-1,4-mannosyl-glycoprotein beta-1,4-N-acetylglucosaminyltransferase n=1 Tax=Ectorhizobium quercum TaxID=2965071 RepID=A0AAE3MYB1_9HYPH|nr:hypothetical protein [Ectorhizobium quercum]MCX8996701.1 hypothetical protein [Ectorhizobium quercum]